MIAFEIFYLCVLLAISAYGAHRYWLVAGATRYLVEQSPTLQGESPPTVLVQLPIYNEPHVVEQLIDSGASLEWDRNRLHIQVLDDSDDGSSEFVERRVAHWRENGVAIDHVRRDSRTGYKAGALECGLQQSSAEYVAIFDADFIIPADFLTRVVPEFLENPRVGMVQCRWGFTNREHSLLTRIQALLLDGHFHVEHRARAGAGRFFNFNGTAGVWRREAIDDAGGWRAETITEDLDLSLRAWLRGWRFRYRDDIVVPSALPEAMAAFKIQQNRWVSGSVQTAKALLGSILRSRLGFVERLDLVFCLTGNCVYLLLLLLALSIPPAVFLRFDATARLLLWADVPFFFLATGSVFAFYLRARPAVIPVGRLVLVQLPALMALGLGMTIHNTRAIVKGFFGHSRVFERTPKGGVSKETVAARSRRGRSIDPVTFLEPTMAVYVAACVAIAVRGGASWFSLPLLALFVWGYLFVFVETLRPQS